MKTPAVAMTATVALIFVILLSGCGTDRPAFDPPDATIVLPMADLTDQTPPGEVVDLIFEVLDEEPVQSTFPADWKPPYRVASQLVVRTHTNQEFMVEGTWRNQQIIVRGVTRPVNEKTGSVFVRYSFEITRLSGALRNKSRMESAVDLKPHRPTQIGYKSSLDRDDDLTFVLWLRPLVTPGQSAPLSQP